MRLGYRSIPNLSRNLACLRPVIFNFNPSPFREWQVPITVHFMFIHAEGQRAVRLDPGAPPKIAQRSPYGRGFFIVPFHRDSQLPSHDTLLFFAFGSNVCPQSDHGYSTCPCLSKSNALPPAGTDTVMLSVENPSVFINENVPLCCKIRSASASAIADSLSKLPLKAGSWTPAGRWCTLCDNKHPNLYPATPCSVFEMGWE